MRITMDLHTHTRYSRLRHGKGTVEENIREARKKGIGLAVSDHGPGHFFYGVRPKKYSAPVNIALRLLGGGVEEARQVLDGAN